MCPHVKLRDVAAAVPSSSSSSSAASPPSGHTPSTAGPGPGVEIAALSIRSMNTAAPAWTTEDAAKFSMVKDLHLPALRHEREHFHGKSSNAMLVKASVQLREDYEAQDMPWKHRRDKFWKFSPVCRPSAFR